uniref:uncharacterized protein LOC100179710 n=1 Tax=Ciona intestinalis TaxID=7719 RepID=UPI000180C499|nr:uncharacterized protein LOC100179710 [Ciona intestinalis]|eukprot:XP_002122461.1 uncharacterized protein LOC100179710 [Ciona intestinalis]
MATALASLPLSHFYHQTLGSDHLSQNLASNESFTPLQQDRFTVSPDRYEEYRSTVKKQARAPWGRLRDYGGMQKIQLPEEFIKLKGYPPVVVQKGHRHYGTGASDSRYLPIPQYYDVTDLKKSNVRTSDQVLPSSPDKQMSNLQIDLPFPAEHPHSSHIERFALFPCFKSPDDRTNGDPIRGQTPLHANAASSAHKFAVVDKTKGAAFRREIQEYPQASKKEPLVWNSEDNIYQLKKTPISGRQAFYPTPPKMVHPNTRLRSEEQTLELRSVNCLRNIERDQWKTTYDYNYTGNGPSNVMHIDDYHKKMINAIESGSDTVDNELMPLTTPIFLPSRPVEGRYARMYQNRRELKADIRYPDEHSADTTLDVVDNRDYLSLPATPNSIRRIDEWYKTGRNTSDPVVERTEVPNRNICWTDKDLQSDDGQWKELQLKNNAEHGLQTVARAQNHSDLSLPYNEYRNLPKKVEELVNLPEETKYYLKDYQEERDIKFKNIERMRELKKLESQYQSKEDLKALRNKLDQMGTRLEPKALDQHSEQITMDKNKEEELRMKTDSCEERYKTGLKFSTEKISDIGSLTDLHNRQLKGYKDFAETPSPRSSNVDPSLQNHQGVLASYITRSNPVSLSLDASKAESGARSGTLSSMSGASTGSILKTPGSPPRAGSSKSISFNEVIRVATSEYGSNFKVTTFPLSNTESTLKRPSTPLPTPHRPIREPSVYSGTLLPGPALRPSTSDSFAHVKTSPRDSWKWNFDTRVSAEFKPIWRSQPGTPYTQSSLMDIQNNWSKSDAHRRLHESLPETAPDLRSNLRHYEIAEKSQDLKFHHSIKHREKRHKFYGFHSYHFYNGNAML